MVYLWPIGLAVGGMVFHNLADIARKAVTPLPPARALPDAPERMPRAARLQHGLLMISFPILTYTGFALTYPEHWWAAPLLHWEATLGLRGGLHRAAALVLERLVEPTPDRGGDGAEGDDGSSSGSVRS